MNRLSLLLMALLLFSACSDKQGKVVEKKTSTDSVQESVAVAPPEISSDPSGELPAGHPPIAGGTSGAMGGMSMLAPAGEGAKAAVIENGIVKVAALKLTVDPSWVSEAPTSSMRAAQFRLPAPEGAEDDALLIIYRGILGSNDANVQRWIGQFKDKDGEPIIEKKKIAGMDVQTLDMKGSSGGGGMMGGSGGAVMGQQMLAASINGHDAGPWHFKATGPTKTLEHWKPAFAKMIDTMEVAQ